MQIFSAVTIMRHIFITNYKTTDTEAFAPEWSVRKNVENLAEWLKVKCHSRHSIKVQYYVKIVNWEWWETLCKMGSWGEGGARAVCGKDDCFFS